MEEMRVPQIGKAGISFFSTKDSRKVIPIILNQTEIYNFTICENWWKSVNPPDENF